MEQPRVSSRRRSAPQIFQPATGPQQGRRHGASRQPGAAPPRKSTPSPRALAPAVAATIGGRRHSKRPVGAPRKDKSSRPAKQRANLSALGQAMGVGTEQSPRKVAKVGKQHLSEAKKTAIVLRYTAHVTAKAAGLKPVESALDIARCSMGFCR